MVPLSRVEAEPERGRDVLLVDEVFTAGTIISERAWVLRRAGAASVYLASVARARKGDRIGIQMEVGGAS
jgi:predicted amidophosphoribosyltransferase